MLFISFSILYNNYTISYYFYNTTVTVLINYFKNYVFLSRKPCSHPCVMSVLGDGGEVLGDLLLGAVWRVKMVGGRVGVVHGL